MAKDIEKIIDTVDVPEMEYTKTKHKSVSYEVPEVVLPKTKAEMYEEAKGRLTQKTTAASKAYRPDKRKSSSKRPAVKTVELETAAAAAAGSASNADRHAEKKNIDAIKKRLNDLKRIVDEPKWVGGADELIPFVWRHPLVDVPKPSKYYRTSVRPDKSRAMLLPVPRDKN